MLSETKRDILFFLVDDFGVHSTPDIKKHVPRASTDALRDLCRMGHVEMFETKKVLKWSITPKGVILAFRLRGIQVRDGLVSAP